MATEKTIKGKRCRYYKDAYIWVSDDGTVVAVKSQTGSWKYLDIKTDSNGEKCVDTGYRIIYVKKAVYVCFCPPVPPDGKNYEICYKDGNKANLYYKNLELKEIVKTTMHTTTSTFNLPSGLIVTENGGIFYGAQELTIYDSYDEQRYFETIEEAAESVSEIVGCTVEATIDAIQEASEKFVEHKESPGEDLFYSSHEFLVIDD